jgi:hypothetical protein
MSKRQSEPYPSERLELGFEEKASRLFSLLEEIGLRKVETSPTIIRYSANGLSASVFHGRISYEIGFEIDYQGITYSLSELIRISDPSHSDIYRRSVATTSAAVSSGLQRTKELL